MKQRTRTCIGCGEQSDKVDLHRIVRTAQGEVRFDETGRAAGRGAYVCSSACFSRAASKGMLQKALKCAIARETMETIADEMERALAGAHAR